LQEKRILKEFISLLSEDDNGLVSAGMEMNPYGIQYTTGDMMYKAFIKPFVDVKDVAAGKTKEVSQGAQTVLKTVMSSMATVVLPVLNKHYDQIFADARKRMEAIRSEYGDVYAATWNAFKDNDIITSAFMYDPGAVLGSSLGKKSLKTTASVLSILSGGSLDGFLNDVKKRFGNDKPPPDRTQGGGGADSWVDESIIREDESKSNPAEFLTNPKVIQKAVSSPEAQRMQAEAGKVIRDILTQAYKQASGVMKATSIQDLQAKTGVKFKGIEELQKVPEAERASAEKQALDTIKKASKALYSKQLEAIVQGVLKAGIPQDSKFVRDFSAVIQKIKGL
jgi:hypothetical protein